MSDEDDIRQTIQTYFEGMHESNATKTRAAFHPNATITGYLEDGLHQLTADEFATFTEQQPSASEPARLEILSIEISGDTACAQVRDVYLGSTFVDSLLLLAVDGKWRIYTKLFNVEGPVAPLTAGDSAVNVTAARDQAQPEKSRIPESHHDLLQTPFAVLATIGPRGLPQLSTVCFLASTDGTVELSVNETRQKAKNMVANSKVSLHITDPTNPSRYLELRGHAMVQPDDAYVFADRLGAKYGDLDLRRMDHPGELRTVVTIRVDRARAVDMRQPGEVGSALRS